MRVQTDICMPAVNTCVSITCARLDGEELTRSSFAEHGLVLRQVQRVVNAATMPPKSTDKKIRVRSIAAQFQRT